MKICPSCQQCYEDTYSVCAKDRSLLIASLTLGRIIAQKYSLDRLLSHNWMGDTYAGTRLETDQPVAITLLMPDGLGEGEARKRFRREAHTIAHLNTRIIHQHVAKTHDYGSLSDGTAYIVTELIVGQTLREYIDNTKPLSVDEAVRIARQLADGIAMGHLCGVVHRDLTPSNIILTRNANQRLDVKIINFGFAKLRERATAGNGRASNVTTSNGAAANSAESLIATLHQNTSPEQYASGHDHGPRSDIYSLGLILYEMLAGRLPDDAPPGAVTSHNHYEAMPSLTEFRPDVPEPLARLVMKSLHPKPLARPDSAADISSELQIIENPPEAATSSATVDSLNGEADAAHLSDQDSAADSTSPTDAELMIVPSSVTNASSHTHERSIDGLSTLPGHYEGVPRRETKHLANKASATTSPFIQEEASEHALLLLNDSPDEAAVFRPRSTADGQSSQVHTDSPVVDASSSRRRSVLFYAGFAAIALIVGFAAFFLLTRGFALPPWLSASHQTASSIPPQKPSVAPPSVAASPIIAESLPPFTTETLPPAEAEATDLVEIKPALPLAKPVLKDEPPTKSDNAAEVEPSETEALPPAVDDEHSRKVAAQTPDAAATPPSDQKPSGDCTMSVSRDSLAISSSGGGGGSNSVTVDVTGSSESAGISASTANWADIAVFPERAAGGRAIRYSVVSVSKKPGTYSVTFNSPCGSKRVTVTAQ